MRLKIISSLFLQFCMVTPVLAVPYTIALHGKLEMIKAHSQSQPTRETCDALVEISNKLLKDMSEKSCTTDSEIAYTFCQQTTNAFNSTEMNLIQNTFNDLKVLSENDCKDKSSSFLSQRIDEISKNM